MLRTGSSAATTTPPAFVRSAGGVVVAARDEGAQVVTVLGVASCLLVTPTLPPVSAVRGQS